MALVSALMAVASCAAIDERDTVRPATEIQFKPFIPDRHKMGYGQSKSQGECATVNNFSMQKCGSFGDSTTIDAHNCFAKCWCDEGNFYCDSLGECSSKEMEKWCKCPGGSNAENNCLGFMELCYCAPEGRFEDYGTWGAGRKVMREYIPIGLGGGDKKPDRVP